MRLNVNNNNNYSNNKNNNSQILIFDGIRTTALQKELMPISFKLKDFTDLQNMP